MAKFLCAERSDPQKITLTQIHAMRQPLVLFTMPTTDDVFYSTNWESKSKHM